MKTSFLLLASTLLCSCAGDLAVTRNSSPQPTRSVAISGRAEVRGAPLRTDRYAAHRVYLVTRPGTDGEPRGEWRTLGGTIREHGMHIEFVEMTSGRTVIFDAPHQITPAPSSTASLGTGDQMQTPSLAGPVVGGY